MSSMLRRGLLLLMFWALAGSAGALTQEQARAVAQGETDDRVAALNALLAKPDPQAAAFVQALADERLKLISASGRVLVADEQGALTDAVTGAKVDPAPAADAIEDVMLNNRLRGAIEAVQAALALQSANAQDRLTAAKALLDSPDEARVPLIEAALTKESDAKVKTALNLARSAALAASPDRNKRLEAARALGTSNTPETRLLLNQRLTDETDVEVRQALQLSLRSVEATLVWGERAASLFSGISLGSILLLVALGLAITYGLMGVINMAHGELMMIGAYATYLVQIAFRRWLPPEAFDAYLLAAVPVAFLASAGVGAVLERTVLRWLYGRPLETLLATWGLSLMLIQAVRSLFGAQNVAVESPSWLGGSVELVPGLALPINRIVIIGFAFAVLGGMALLIARTRLGLFVRAVTQNRPIASCMGVPTARVDTYAFALGSGLAGLAGCALSQVGNVGPDLGQGYIVDSFMVVVLGGVGQLAGTVLAAMGLGLANKALEGVVGAVLAKIAVLLFIIVFIQKRPQGLFAVKGRQLD
jgi:urea transport system permease protein